MEKELEGLQQGVGIPVFAPRVLAKVIGLGNGGREEGGRREALFLMLAKAGWRW